MRFQGFWIGEEITENCPYVYRAVPQLSTGITQSTARPTEQTRSKRRRKENAQKVIFPFSAYRHVSAKKIGRRQRGPATEIASFYAPLHF